MKTKGRKKKGNQEQQMRCPYCGSRVIYRSAEGIYKDNSRNAMLYVCSKYPECDAYVRVHAGTKIPVGSLANQELRKLRREVHYYFNQLYESGLMSKQDAYQWLADIISAPMSEAHIGHMGDYYCRQVIQESKKLLEEKTKQNNIRHFQVIRGGGRDEPYTVAAKKGGREYRTGVSGYSR